MTSVIANILTKPLCSTVAITARTANLNQFILYLELVLIDFMDSKDKDVALRFHYDHSYGR